MARNQCWALVKDVQAKNLDSGWSLMNITNANCALRPTQLEYAPGLQADLLAALQEKCLALAVSKFRAFVEQTQKNSREPEMLKRAPKKNTVTNVRKGSFS